MEMQMETQDTEHQILTLILSDNQCHKCIHLAREKGICGGIITLGRGTVKSSVLHLLGIKSQKKEIISFLLEKEQTKEMLDFFTAELQLHEPGHGIAFTTPVVMAGCRPGKTQESGNTEQAMKEEGMRMYKKLTVVVDRGMGEDVMEIARKAGVRGGTIMHGRAAGAEYTEKLFGMEIEPEKELVLILIPDELVEKVADALYQELHLEEPGKGILFVEPVVDVRGLFESNPQDKASD
ncbi:P-II family nitrogen regulator [Thermoclostridium caenicola]|uniref:Nitrogen regulatory protein P-II family n=1 Tax=Thermoclostridium caenicola TaxID=659425 RepID=A0A1M6ARL6_9FIRM|nr:P-II family nitrogen regulator [Thermoclostridium caenicola]SHI39116.1 nitrogen regulatory protein P-II family [Thermoclostridium caenicola]HPO77985.1 P-II family nitrogen regulator [Thermoclostridium caenicola]